MHKKELHNFIRSFNLFEIIWMLGVLISLTLLIILMPDLMFEDKENTLVVICSVISIISSPICEILISKQSRYWTLFSLIFVEITDIIILFALQLFSSAAISLFFWIPFDIATFFKWSGKNKDEERNELTKVKTYEWWQDLIIVVIMVLSGIILGFILPDTGSNPHVVAFSNVFEIANGIFLLKRHNEQWIAWFGYLICEIIIWVSMGHYIMLITVFAMMINTVYGFAKWLLYIKRKKQNAATVSHAAL